MFYVINIIRISGALKSNKLPSQAEQIQLDHKAQPTPTSRIRLTTSQRYVNMH